MSTALTSSEVKPAVAVDHGEAPITLTESAPRALSTLDQLGFWGNLGVSLFGLTLVYVTFYIGDGLMSLTAAITALVLGTVIGAAILGVSLMLGARSGVPTMVVLRGVLGGRASYVPTVLNIAQNLGWAVYEIILIATSLRALVHQNLPQWLCVLMAGSISTALTIRPLGWIRALRKYVMILVIIAIVVLTIGLAGKGIPDVGGSWSGFWLTVDAVIALCISWVPLSADYSRHSHTERSAFIGGFVGYGLAQIGCMLVGLLALVQVIDDPSKLFDFYVGLPLGAAAMTVLILRETDQSFVNVFSTALSIQNLAPRLDRRVLTVVIGTLVTLAALKVSVDSYLNFLFLIGAAFVPMSGVMTAAWLRTRGEGLNIGAHAPTRLGMLIAWLGGVVTYQVINPGTLSYWSDFWTNIGEALNTLGHTWLSASVTSFLVAVLLALPFARVSSHTGNVTHDAGVVTGRD